MFGWSCPNINLALRVCENCHNGETNLYKYEFHSKIFVVLNKCTKITRKVKKKFLIYKKQVFIVVPKVSSFSKALILSFLEIGFLQVKKSVNSQATDFVVV